MSSHTSLVTSQISSRSIPLGRVTSHLSRLISHLPPSTFHLSLFLLLALLFLWPLTLHPNFIPFIPRASYSDLLITHLPNAEYLRDALARYGQWPLWNAQILAGQPFAADPLAGMWYPPNLVLLTRSVPLPFAFNLLFVLHLAWAGYGLFRFLRDEGLDPGPALLGGVAFMGTPKLVAHLGAGHVSLVFAVAWTPWLLLAVKRAAMQGGLKRGALAGACLSLLLLADVRWAFYAAVLGAAFWVARLIRSARQLSRGAGLFAALAFAAVFFSLSAILAFPLTGFIRQSSRSALTLKEAVFDSLPPRYLLGLLIPDLGGFHEWMTYLSVVPLMLAFVGALRRQVFWISAVLLAAAFSLGSNFVLFPLLFQLLPGLGFLRVPPRAWFVVALGVSILAAHGAQMLIDEILPRLAKRYSQPSPSSRSIPAGPRNRASSLWDLVTVSPPLPHIPAPSTFHVPPRSGRKPAGARRPSTFLLPLLLLLTLADLLRVDSTLLEARERPARPPAAEWIAAQPGLFRVYSPSYSLPPGDGLQHVDGVNPLQLASAVTFIEAASGVKAHGYSVTVPAFASDDLATANADALPDAERLGMLNVKYVAAEFSLDAPGLALVQTFGRTRVYENAAARPRAWVIGGAALSLVEAGRAEVQAWSPNRILVEAAGPGQLVLSEVIYGGWEARVDGVLTPIETVAGLLRGVRLPEGNHQVAFEFRPRSVAFGASLTLLGLVALAVIWRWQK